MQRVTTHSWFPDEVALAGRENLDPDHVARYDAKMDSEAQAEVELLRSNGMDPSSTVLEFGPGTGQFTVAAAPRCARVIAVDPSPPMLQALRRRLAGTEIDNVEVATGGFLTYERSEPVDVIYSRFALHHLPDFWKALALRRMRSLLAPHGMVRLSDVVYNFELSDAEIGVEAWCSSFGAQTEEDWSREEVEEHVRDEHSTFTWLLELMIERAGFDFEASYSEDGIVASYLMRAAGPATSRAGG
jgi:SAM-dependent methyltransferase